MTTLKRFLSRNKPLVGLIVLMAAVAVMSPSFMTVDNLLNILRQTSINAVIAVGMTYVILSGGIDLSVGSVLAFCGAVCAWLVAGDLSIWLAIPLSLLLGAGLGAINGVVIGTGGVQPFVATLVAMTMLRGATLVFTDGRPITTGTGAAADAFWSVGGGYLLGIPVPVVVAAAVFAVCGLVLTRTRFGRYTYAVGGNEVVARLSGIRVNLEKTTIYALSGLLAALAGVILTARLESAQPTAGAGYELDAIAAVVVGGTSLSGGKGTLFGTLVGALIIGVLNNALNLMDVSSYYQMIAKGAVILLAVLADSRKSP
ncbi:ribose ABC transporter permease [Azospirillum melinis]|uniref:Ribose ABC transporter permease n=2 Tax=Azospirillum TaxID=191 RepID=A0A2B8BGJ5_9PROT|nr:MULTISPECIES: ribose ABC transporter permease [Azospirillum]MBP2306594.1 ribose transport system permease protein [Azospirillum melinis]NUA98048.1 ribose ABC transporter permease [Azospirillum melinis]PGH57015.1 ribose ABC transporter permease [Azospirillum palustre]PWC49740.1 ribose ABC transporter permease [Azospirillum sp. TSA6c]